MSAVTALHRTVVRETQQGVAGCGAIARTTKAALEAAYDDCPSGPSKALQRAFQRRRASGAPRDALGRAHSHKHKMRGKALRTHKNTRCVGRPSALKDLAESRPDSFAAGGEQDRTHATFAHMMMVPRSPSSPFLFLIMACIDRSERRARVRASRVMCTPANKVAHGRARSEVRRERRRAASTYRCALAAHGVGAKQIHLYDELEATHGGRVALPRGRSSALLAPQRVTPPAQAK